MVLRVGLAVHVPKVPREKYYPAERLHSGPVRLGMFFHKDRVAYINAANVDHGMTWSVLQLEKY